MVTTTRTASRPDARIATEASPETVGGAVAQTRPLPDVPHWMRDPFDPGVGSAVLPGLAMMRATPAMAILETAFDGMAQMQAEMARFGAWRAHRALEAQAEMLACRSRAELRGAQRTYMEGLAEDYVREWSRLCGYGLRVGLGQPLPPRPEPPEERHATAV
jgi:hypothetical protein